MRFRAGQRVKVIANESSLKRIFASPLYGLTVFIVNPDNGLGRIFVREKTGGSLVWSLGADMVKEEPEQLTFVFSGEV